MPVYLKDTREFDKLEQFKSVLIVPCRFCPAASFAVRKKEPYFAAISGTVDDLTGPDENSGLLTLPASSGCCCR